MSFVKLTKTQNQFLESYLRGTNRELTAAQAIAQFGIKNIRARMTELRQAGLQVYRRKNYAGRAAYSISSRDVVGRRAKVFVAQG